MNILKRLFKYVIKLKNKIAFYPTVLSVLGLLFALVMYYFESLGVSKYLTDNAPFLVINDSETARSLLTTFIAGLISIMVFSFSMVMILLNQASSNFSPRILPGLISNKRHQIVLGIYNSTLLYCIFTLVAIEPDSNKYQLPGFSILLSILAMTFCLGAFIYFIHSISHEIQINNIMARIFTIARDRLQHLLDIESETNMDFPESSGWITIESKTTGYLQDFNIEILKEISDSSNTKIEIVAVKGTYVHSGTALYKTSVKLKDSVEDEITNSFHYSKSELIEDNYLLAFKQITEIAVKAISPGINDPGTAINAIDYLTELFRLRLLKNDVSLVPNSSGVAIINIKTVSFEDLMYQTMASLRGYCKQDIILVQKLFKMLNFLKDASDVKHQSYIEVIENEIKNLYYDVKEVLYNETDLQKINHLYNK